MNIIDTIRMKLALALFPMQQTRDVSKKEFNAMIGTVKGSKDATELFIKYMELFNIPFIENKRIDRGEWHFNIVTLAVNNQKKDYIITFKRSWLYAFDKIFKLDTGEQGTGLNSKLLEYAKENNIADALIVRPNGEMYLLDINMLLDYSNANGTVRQEKDAYEFHCPISMLKKILTVTEDNVINQQIKQVYPNAKL